MIEDIKSVWILIGMGAMLFWVALIEKYFHLSPLQYFMGFVAVTFLTWLVTVYLDWSFKKGGA